MSAKSDRVGSDEVEAGRRPGDNVEICISLDGKPVETKDWNAVTGDGWRRQTYGDEYSGYVQETCEWFSGAQLKPIFDGSSLKIDAGMSIHSGYELVARRYIEEGYGVSLSLSEKKPQWPKSYTFEVNRVDEKLPQAAHMCVTGQVNIPHKMDFCFPVSLTVPPRGIAIPGGITVPGGFTMKFWLGQSSVQQSFSATLKDLYAAGKAAAKACGAAEADQDADAMKQSGGTIWISPNCSRRTSCGM